MYNRAYMDNMTKRAKWANIDNRANLDNRSNMDNRTIKANRANLDN